MATDLDTRTATTAVLAIIASLGSYVTSCAGHPGWGLVLALIAIPLGVVGLVKSTSPRVTGGILSITAIALAAIGVLLAILVMAGLITAWLV
ncbi:MAG: hypothetical protein WD009_10060, partial [Phycisphaeraceae bacterium]